MERTTGPQKPSTIRKHRDAAGRFTSAPAQQVEIPAPRNPNAYIPLSAAARRRLEEEHARRRAQRAGLPYTPRLEPLPTTDRTDDANAASSPVSVAPKVSSGDDWGPCDECTGLPETDPRRDYTPAELLTIGVTVVWLAFIAAMAMHYNGMI
jgi:hypothetical protein